MKKFSNLKEEVTTKYELKDTLRNDIYSLIESSLSIKIFGESSLDKDISIIGKEELVEKIKSLIDDVKINERVLTLEHVKANVHRNFDMNWLNEQINILNERKNLIVEGENWLDGTYNSDNYKTLVSKIENIFSNNGTGASFQYNGKDFTIIKKGNRYLISSSTDWNYEALDVNGAILAAHKFSNGVIK